MSRWGEILHRFDWHKSDYSQLGPDAVAIIYEDSRCIARTLSDASRAFIVANKEKIMLPGDQITSLNYRQSLDPYDLVGQVKDADIIPGICYQQTNRASLKMRFEDITDGGGAVAGARQITFNIYKYTCGTTPHNCIFMSLGIGFLLTFVLVIIVVITVMVN